MNFDDLGGVIIALAQRGMVNDYFSGWFEDGLALRAETRTGSIYNVELRPGGTSEKFDFLDPHLMMDVSFDIRPGTAVINGTRVVGYVGHNIETGTLLVLDETKAFIRRSSTLGDIVRLDNVS